MGLRSPLAAMAGLLVLSACASNAPVMTGGSTSAVIECAPYARQVSGIQLYGDAASWWDNAAGRYGRSSEPSPGAVLVFRRSSRLPYGHVSVVATTPSSRQIEVTQANWVHGRIARREPVVDVSPGNDWSAVRVWWAPSGQLGTTVYPTFGFILPAGRPRSDLVAQAQ
jgi:surface antigen